MASHATYVLLLAGACTAQRALNWIAWRRSARDLPFGVVYPGASRFFFGLPPSAIDWETTRVAGRRDVIFCQRPNRAIAARSLIIVFGLATA